MSKNRIQYNCQALYVGPSPSNTFHFIDVNGTLNNDTSYNDTNFNLLKKINRVTNLNYSINIPREEIKQMGKSAIASTPILNQPTVLVDFEYYLNGVTNEARLGFNVNHEYIDETKSGQCIFNGFDYFLFSGLSIYDKVDQPIETPFWPSHNRSSKNIFGVITKNEYEDENTKSIEAQKIFSRNANVICFGDGYLTSYDTTCAIGETPKAKASFICDNVVFYTGSSGVAIPAINPKDGLNYSGKKFILPEDPDLQNVSIILPGDIIIDIQETGNGISTQMNDIETLGVKFSDIKIQDYNISIKFDREDMTSIGYKAPASRRINFPIQVNFGFTNLVGDESEAKLHDSIRLDKRYNVSIKMKDRATRKELIRYDFKNASLQDYRYTSSIEAERRLNFNFRINCTQDNLSEGLFVSGILSNIYTADYVLFDEDEFLLQEDGDKLLLNLVPLY